MVIIQASHVGYAPINKRFGVYRRLQTDDSCETSNCGKINGALEWYLHEYEFACQNIFLSKENNEIKVTIDNLLLHNDRVEGLFLNLEKNLISVMPYVVTSKWPALTAAQTNTQVEFDRAFRTIITGLNVDISPQQEQFFPLTKFIPWAAYVQDEKGNHHIHFKYQEVTFVSLFFSYS